MNRSKPFLCSNNMNLFCKIFHLTGGAEGYDDGSSTDAGSEADTLQERGGRRRKFIICSRERQKAGNLPSTTGCSGQALIFRMIRMFGCESDPKFCTQIRTQIR